MGGHKRTHANVDESLPHVVVLGGGFAGLNAVRELAGQPMRVTLVDQHNHHLFQPLLYQVATAGLAAPDIAMPLRRILKHQKNVTVFLDRVTGVDLDDRKVLLTHGELTFDYLIVATGMVTNYFGRNEWEQHAPGLKSIDDAIECRRRALLAYEAAEIESSSRERAALMTFVVVGAGPTGVEMAGALSEVARQTLTRNFRRIDPADARVLLLEGGDRVLPGYPADLSERARYQLEELGVEVRVGTMVRGIDERGIDLDGERVEARTVIWAAGVRGSDIGHDLSAHLERDGRVPTLPDLSLPEHPNVFVVGDLAAIPDGGGGRVPGLAPAAIQAGRHAARNIVNRLSGKSALPFEYKDRGAMATIGRSRAVAVIGRLRLSGPLAWLAWIAIHVFFLIGFRNRFVVLFEWAWAYMTYQRSARVIFYPWGRRSSVTAHHLNRPTHHAHAQNAATQSVPADHSSDRPHAA